MSIYVDNARLPFRGYVMSHMTADTLDELHAMADQIGMKRQWFQTPPKASHPHYDIPEHLRTKALALGALEVGPRTTLHYAARLGLEWVEVSGCADLRSRFEYTVNRTQQYAIQTSAEILV